VHAAFVAVAAECYLKCYPQGSTAHRQSLRHYDLPTNVGQILVEYYAAKTVAAKAALRYVEAGKK
jgi:hypothetical protein